MNQLWNLTVILAQQVQIEDSGGGMGDFVSQIAGLLVVTVIAGVVWIGLMVMIFQRAAERRRRKKEGLEPLPSIPTQLRQWWENRNQPGTPYRSMAAPRRSPSMSVAAGDIPMPDLDDLASDDFNIDDVLGAAPTPAPAQTRGEVINPPPAPAPAPEPAPIIDVPLQEPEVSTAMNYVPGSNQLPEDAVEIMRVWRDVTDGTIIIGMRDRLFATHAELDDDLGRRYRKLVQDLSRLASATPAAPIPAAPARRPMAAPPASKSSAAQPPAENEPAPVVSPVVSIGEQIENLLQMRLLQNPQFQGRRIHVRSGASGGVMIEVDGQYYEAVSDIGDAVVRSFIQETIQAWEASQ